MPNENQRQQTAQHTRSYVLWCDDKSIDTGQISLLAVAEVIAAIALYWWLAYQFDSHWMALISLIAAPMLLLRSPASIELGVGMLRRYWIDADKTISRREKVAVVLISVLTTGLVAYWLIAWLQGYVGFALVWRTVVLGAAVVMVSFVVSTMVLHRGVRRGAVVVPFLITGMTTIVVAGVVVGVSAIAGIAAGMFAIWTIWELNSRGGARRLFVLLMPAVTLGMLLRTLLIRWVATLLHLPAGLAKLPHNWRETLFVIDLRHQPELLPHAGRVDPMLTAQNIWRHKTRLGETGGLILLAAWYLPTLAYRWSLKASAWLWWPLALLLSSPLEGMDERKSREKIAISVGGAWRSLLPWITFVVFGWLISALPATTLLLHMLPNEAAALSEELIASVSPPDLGVRYITLWLFCILSLVFWWHTENLKASYGEEVKSIIEFNALASEDKVRFRQLVLPIEKLRMQLIFTMLVLGEAYAVVLFHSIDPQVTEKFVPTWLLRVL